MRFLQTAEMLQTPPRVGWAALALLLAAWTVYSPGLNRVFVVDQLQYFVERDGDTSLSEGLRHADYQATRRYWKGDEALFRPLSFVWLAIANRLFTHHHVWWNVAELGLHVLVGVVLYQCLVTIWPSMFALAAALLFIVSKPSIELALWNHLGGYLLAWAALLIALRAFVHITRASGAASRRDTAVYVIALTAAEFLHEVAVPMALLAGILIVAVERARGQPPAVTRMLVLMSPLLVFAALYSVHVLHVERFSFVDERPGGIFSARNIAVTVPKTVEALITWTREIAVPVALDIRPEPFERFTRSFAFSARRLPQVINLALLVAAMALFVRVRRRVARASPLVVLLLGAMCAYAGLISWGRPLGGLRVIFYYLYFFNLLALMVVYASVDGSRIRGRVGALAGAIVAALIVLQGVDTRAASLDVGRVNRDASRYFSRLEAFVDAHRAEPNFTFTVVNPPDDLDPLFTLLEGYPDRPTATSERRITEIVFRSYYDATAPVHVLDGRDLVSR